MAWNKANPAAGIQACDLDDLIRTNNNAIEATIYFGHDFISGSTQTGEHHAGSAKIYCAATAPTTKEDSSTALDSDDVGVRLWLDTSTTPDTLKVLTAIGTPNTWTAIGTFLGDTLHIQEASGDPSGVANVGHIYAKESDSKTELFILLDSGGSAVQVTKNSLLYLDNGRLSNNTTLKALNNAGDGTVDLIRATTGDLAMLAQNCYLDSSSNILQNDQVANKLYVDTAISDAAPAAATRSTAWGRYTGGESGDQLVDGYNTASVTWSTDHYVVAFTSALADANYAVSVTKTEMIDRDTIWASDMTVNGFNIYAENFNKVKVSPSGSFIVFGGN